MWERACSRRRPTPAFIWQTTVQYLDMPCKKKFQRIPARIEQKHRRLFAHQPLKTNPRLNHETRLARDFNRSASALPFFHALHYAEMRHGYVMAVNRVGMGGFLRGVFWREVDHQLVAEKVEIDPVLAGAAFLQAKHATVEVPRSGARS